MYAVTITESSCCWNFFRIDWTFDFHHFVCLCMEYFLLVAMYSYTIPIELCRQSAELHHLFAVRCCFVSDYSLCAVHDFGKTKNKMHYSVQMFNYLESNPNKLTRIKTSYTLHTTTTIQTATKILEALWHDTKYSMYVTDNFF